MPSSGLWMRLRRRFQRPSAARPRRGAARRMSPEPPAVGAPKAGACSQATARLEAQAAALASRPRAHLKSAPRTVWMRIGHACTACRRTAGGSRRSSLLRRPPWAVPRRRWVQRRGCRSPVSAFSAGAMSSGFAPVLAQREENPRLAAPGDVAASATTTRRMEPDRTAPRRDCSRCLRLLAKTAPLDVEMRPLVSPSPALAPTRRIRPGN